MDPFITFKLFLLFTLFLLAGFFASSEASLFSLTPLHLHKMREDGSRSLSATERLLQFPRRLLITILVGNESVNIMISALTVTIFIRLLGDQGKWAAIVVLAPLLLVFGEAIPKTIAKINPIAVSQRVTPPLILFSRVAFPVVWVMDGLSGWLIRAFRTEGGVKREGVTEEEIRSFVDAGHEEGVLETTHRDLIHRVFELGDTAAEDIMTPRIDMFCLSSSHSLIDMKREILKSGYSRVPVYGTDRDDILGILYAKDLLQEVEKKGKDLTVLTLLRRPYFIPLEKRTDSLLRDFRARKIHMAVVVDEYGGVAGVVTMEDILESLFGDIYDERDESEKPYHVIDENTLVVSGRMPVEDFNALTGMDVPSDDFDTVGGFVFHLFGRLPAKGEAVRFADRVFRVDRMLGARIWRIKVTKEEGRPEEP